MVTSLIFCSPDTFDYSNDYLVLDVDSEMLDQIKRGPTFEQDYDRSSGSSSSLEYAYVFGELFDVDTYEHPGFFKTLSGQIGFIEEARAKKKYRKGGKTRDYETICGPFTESADSNDYLKEVGKKYPEIVWIGLLPKVTTEMHHLHLHFHVDPKKDRIDSILIDAGWAFSVEIGADKTISSSSCGEETDYSSD